MVKTSIEIDVDGKITRSDGSIVQCQDLDEALAMFGRMSKALLYAEYNAQPDQPSAPLSGKL